jgi:hypothetical protein
MWFFRWLYRLPGRINRSFGPTVAATGATGTRHQGVDPVGVTIVAEEIEGSARYNKVDDEGDDPTAD